MIKLSRAIPIAICFMSFVDMSGLMRFDLYIDSSQTRGSSIFPTLTVLTCSLIEPTVVRLILAVSILFFSLRGLELVWTSKEMLSFLVFSVGIPGIVLLLFGKFATMFVNADSYYPVCGCGGLIVSVLVGYRHVFPYREIVNVKQLVPGSVLEYLPCNGVLQARHLPFSLVLMELVLWMFWPGQFPDVFLTLLSLFTSWLYIRYLMYFSYANEQGDHSSEFALSMLFPKVTRRYLDRGTAQVYLWAVAKGGTRLALREKPSTVLYSPSDTSYVSAADSNEAKKKAFMVLEETIAANALTREEIAEV